MRYNIEELRKKFNKGTIEEQNQVSTKFIKAMNPGIKTFLAFPQVDVLSKEEEEYIREGILEANQLRK